MDDAIVLGFLVLAAGLAGWVLGIIGFFNARRARAEAAALRSDLAQVAARQAAQPTVAAAAVPIGDAELLVPEADGARPPDIELLVPEATEPALGSVPRVVPMPPAEAAMPSEPADAATPPVPAEAVTPPLTRATAPSPADAAATPPVDAPTPPPQPGATTPRPQQQGTPRPASSPDLETLLTTRWGVWLGAVALLLSGVFLIRYAVEHSMLGPAPRCILAGLLGVALIVAAEWPRRRKADAPALPDFAAPALAAGGVAVLFAAAYGAGVLYALLPPLLGFVLMAVASFAGLALSLRHGQLVAAVGVVGAFVAPALIETESPSLPGLFIYLLFVTAAALGVVRYSAWIWLGWATTIAGAVWVLLALIAGPAIDAWAPGFFVPAAAALNLALLPPAALDHPIGRRLAWIPYLTLAAVGLLLEQVIADWPTRAAVLAMAPLAVWKASREPRLVLLPFLAALAFLLMLAGWSLHITDFSDISAPPGHWTPAVVTALLVTAALGAGFFAASGLWFERRRDHPLPWSAQTAAIPILALVVCYWRVAGFEPRPGWAATALLLAFALTAVAAEAWRQPTLATGWSGARGRAGTHAAGAVSALALGFAMLLTDQWLTVAIALLLPALAWIEAEADLPPLRHISVAVAGVVLIRLLGNRYVLDYAIGARPLLNGLLVTYGAPAASFALAAAMFRRRRDDLTNGVLEVGATALATVLAALEIHHHATGGNLTAASGSFGEAALHVASLAIIASVTDSIAVRLGRPVLAATAGVLALLGVLSGAALLALNPWLTGATVGTLPVLDWLLPGYLLPAILAARSVRRVPVADARIALAAYALVAGFAWLTLEIRHLFHLSGMQHAPVTDAELWAWSGAWLAYGGALLVAGILGGSPARRRTGLAIIGLATAKVFLVDMGGLVGLWRVLSFLGLGLALIGLSAIYRRFVVGHEPPQPGDPASA